MKRTAAALRVAYPKALSTLVRVTGSLDRAEDLLQDAVAKALVRWSDDGLPDQPSAWLVRTARNQAIDGYRRAALERRYVDAVSVGASAGETPDVEEVGLRDDMLRLVFTCCHPVLKKDVQVALTLKAVAGLSIEEIANALFEKPRTIEQRITRAKRRIREAEVPYEVPSASQLPDRLEAALAVVHLIFNEGYSASIDAPIIRHELCQLAIGQARLALRLFPGDPEVEGLLALLLLSDSRAPARVDDDGALVPLDRQDRAKWRRTSIDEGLALLDSALRRGRPGVYQVQAAISAVHCRARRFEDTNWANIVRLYDALLDRTPSPVLQLNRAVAVSRVRGTEAGLALVDALADARGMRGRHSFHAVRGGLLEELGRDVEAKEAFQHAARLTSNPSTRRYLEHKVTALEEESSPTGREPVT